MAGLVDNVAGVQRIQISLGDFSAFDKPVGHAAPCRPNGERGIILDAGLISAHKANNPVMLSSDVRNAIAATRPDDMNWLIRPGRKLLRLGRPAFRPHPGYLAWHRNNCFKN